MLSRLIVPVVVLPLLLTACAGEKESPTTSASPTASATPSAPVPSPTASTTPSFAGTGIMVTITGSKVAPRPSTRKVAKGATVKITVTSDKDDELHVHGYDKTLALPAGKPATLSFKAEQTGVFEVETHGGGLLLFKIEVS